MVKKIRDKGPKMETNFICVFSSISHLVSFGNYFPKRLIRYVDNVFWKDCLNAYCDFSAAIKVTPFDDFLSEMF